MGLLEQEIIELRELLQQVKQGKIKPEEANTQIAIYSQSEKRVKMIIATTVMSLKSGGNPKEICEKISDSGIALDGTTINLNNDPEIELVKCPVKNSAIIRSECLDISGDDKNRDSCRDCKNFSITRKKLL